MFAALIAGWAFGWRTVSALVVCRHGWQPAFGHFFGCAAGVFSALGLFCLVGAFFDGKDALSTRIVMAVFGLLLLAPFVHLWRKWRAVAGTAPNSTAAPVPASAPAVTARAELPLILEAVPPASAAPDPLRVSLLGLDAEAMQQMQHLCQSEGFVASDFAHPMSIFAIVPDGTASTCSYRFPAVSLAAAPAALNLVIDRTKNHPKAASLHNLRVAVDFSRAKFDPDFMASQEPSLPAALPSTAQATPTPPRRSKAAQPSKAPTHPPAQGVTLPCAFIFSYRGQDGDHSRRTVNVTAISASGGHAYLEGFCHDRMDIRTFRTDRIRGDLTDAKTGELVPVKRLLSSVRTRTSMDYRPPASAPQSRPAKEWQTSVLFTGFSASRRDELESLAESSGWDVRAAVGSTLDYLVTGPRGGPSKVSKAQELGVCVIGEDTFLALVE